MKKVIFNKKEVKRDWPASSLAPVLYWVSVDEPKFRYTTIMGALKWGHEIYGIRKFEVDIEEGTISIDVKPKIDTTKELLRDEGLENYEN
jgi:hypothetical protein